MRGNMEQDQTQREVLAGGTVVYTAPGHRILTDSLLLAAFCTPKPDASVLDLGAGCGTLALSLADRGHRGPITCVELEAEAAGLLRRSVSENGLEAQFRVVEGDLRQFKTPRPFDAVLANPPYFSSGAMPRQAARARARHDGDCTLEQLCRAAAKSLKDGGRLYLCIPPVRLAGLFRALAGADFAPKRLQLVRTEPEREPWLALVEGRRGGGEGLRVLPDRIFSPGDVAAPESGE